MAKAKGNQEVGDEYDYQQEIANTGFGDMLHDSERNQKYYAALRKVINTLHNEGKNVHVLDIGTGTGILSMMAIQAGADMVTACEAFRPMADCAERIFQANGFGDRIHLIKKRSTELIVGNFKNADMSTKANVLVTELLDTELIGEGAISIYNHAHVHLLSDDVVCIPARATCYAQVAESPLASQWNTLKTLPNLDGEVLLKAPKAIANCYGGASLHDVQMSQLPAHLFQTLTMPVNIFEFDFCSKRARETERSHDVVVSALMPGSTNLVFYWWAIDMDIEDEIKLSCAPIWAHPEANYLDKIPWRDHWMQAIYYISKPLLLSNSGTEFILRCNHDEYSLWFSVAPKNDSMTKEMPIEELQAEKRFCICGLHTTYSRTRIGQLNQATRSKTFMRFLESNIDQNSRLLCIGDGCIIGMAALNLGAQKVIHHERHRSCRSFMQQLAKENDLERTVRFIDRLNNLDDATLATITHVFAEPFFLNAILPWDNFIFGQLLSEIIAKLNQSVIVAPYGACIYALPVEFADLQKKYLPIKECEGFNLELFDEMVESSAQMIHSNVEAQPLWEYPCRALADPCQVLSVEFRQFFKQGQKTSGTIPIAASGSCNGIALWVDWQIDESVKPALIISTGPIEPVKPGTKIQWDMFVRQGVHVFKQPQSITANDAISWNLNFDPFRCELEFDFNISCR